MLHELATSINDLVSFNTRLTPYLLTLQRWLTENEELGNVSLVFTKVLRPSLSNLPYLVIILFEFF